MYHLRSGDDIAQSEVPIPGLRPGNREDKLGDVAEAMRIRPWLGKLVRDVKAGNRTAIVTTSLGALVVTTAVGAGLELGIRHGQDLRELAQLVENWRRRRKRRR